MRWLYRIQQRLALTKTESNVLLVLMAFLLVGIVAKEVQRRSFPVKEGAYVPLREQYEAAEATAVPAERNDGAGAEETSRDVAVAEADTTAATGRVDLNRAPVAELERLPRIGPVLARRIVAYRAAHGAFQTVDDVVQVRGIGRKTLEELHPHVTITDP